MSEVKSCKLCRKIIYGVSNYCSDLCIETDKHYETKRELIKSETKISDLNKELAAVKDHLEGETKLSDQNRKLCLHFGSENIRLRSALVWAKGRIDDALIKLRDGATGYTDQLNVGIDEINRALEEKTGFNFEIDPSIPPGEIHIKQGQKVICKVVNVGGGQ